jgi:hypothetical protein
MVHTVMGRPTAGWALRRNLMVHGVDSPLEFFRLAPAYSLVGIEHEIGARRSYAAQTSTTSAPMRPACTPR